MSKGKISPGEVAGEQEVGVAGAEVEAEDEAEAEEAEQEDEAEADEAEKEGSTEEQLVVEDLEMS